MMIIILLNVFPQLFPRFYLIKTSSQEEDQPDQEGQDYAGVDGDSVLDCSSNNNYFCRHIAQLFKKQKMDGMKTD